MLNLIPPLAILVLGLVVISRSRGTLINSRLTSTARTRSHQNKIAEVVKPMDSVIKTESTAVPSSDVNPLGDIYSILGEDSDL